MTVNSDSFSLNTTDDRFTDEFEKIKDLCEQQYFELIQANETCRLVYLMNDAVESFLVFDNYRINGEYIPDSDDPFTVSVEQNGNCCIMIVHQGYDNVFTLSFTGLSSETFLYNYGATGHFWMKGHEKLRLIDYWLGIIREKYNILGPEYCSETEIKLAALAYFRPLRYYNSVPEKYMIENDYIYETTADAVAVFSEFCNNTGDIFFLNIAEKYSDKKLKLTASLLSGKKGMKITGYIIELIQKASADYPDRSHVKSAHDIVSEAVKFADALKEKGLNPLILREEPFEKTEDTMNFSVTVFAEKNTPAGLKTIKRTFSR